MSVNEAAAKTLKGAKTKKADPPSPVEVDLDLDFLDADPSDVAPYYAKAGKEVPKDMTHRWINADPRVIERRINKGWKPVDLGSVSGRRGDTILAAMPKERADKIKARIKERAELRQGAPMAKFETEASKFTKDGRLQVTD